MSPFTLAILGGVLIGLASALLLLFNGRIAGVSGIVGGLIRAGQSDKAWRFAFVLGLLIAGSAVRILKPELIETDRVINPVLISVAGLLVGYGTAMGSGCTSGHGICGIGRFSVRSLIATIVFIGVGMLTTTVLRAIWGGL